MLRRQIRKRLNADGCCYCSPDSISQKPLSYIIIQAPISKELPHDMIVGKPHETIHSHNLIIPNTSKMPIPCLLAYPMPWYPPMMCLNKLAMWFMESNIYKENIMNSVQVLMALAVATSRPQVISTILPFRPCTRQQRLEGIHIPRLRRFPPSMYRCTHGPRIFDHLPFCFLPIETCSLLV